MCPLQLRSHVMTKISYFKHFLACYCLVIIWAFCINNFCKGCAFCHVVVRLFCTNVASCELYAKLPIKSPSHLTEILWLFSVKDGTAPNIRIVKVITPHSYANGKVVTYVLSHVLSLCFISPTRTLILQFLLLSKKMMSHFKCHWWLHKNSVFVALLVCTHLCKLDGK